MLEFISAGVGVINCNSITTYHLGIVETGVRKKITPEKSSPWGVRGRASVRLGIGLDLESGGFFLKTVESICRPFLFHPLLHVSQHKF